jgi:proteasome maturation protein
MSLRIVPESNAPNTYSHVSQSTSAPSAPGLYDVLRNGIGPAAASASNGTTPIDSTHPLEVRLKNWDETQRALRQQMLRRNLGKAEPIRRDLELKTVRDGEWRPVALYGAQPSVHEDILMGKDDTITWEDVFTGDDMRQIPGIHDEMEKRLGV